MFQGKQNNDKNIPREEINNFSFGELDVSYTRDNVYRERIRDSNDVLSLQTVHMLVINTDNNNASNR